MRTLIAALSLAIVTAVPLAACSAAEDEDARTTKKNSCAVLYCPAAAQQAIKESLGGEPEGAFVGLPVAYGGEYYLMVWRGNQKAYFKPSPCTCMVNGDKDTPFAMKNKDW